MSRLVYFTYIQTAQSGSQREVNRRAHTFFSKT
jgi:hypothetical protein